jgi:predicted PurR-regulated permease PerM
MKPNRIEKIAGLAALSILLVGCYVVIRPFLSPLLWAAILCFSTWPVYCWWEKLLGGRRTLAATVMTLLIAAVLVAPFVIVGANLADNIALAITAVLDSLHEGLPEPPTWVGRIPVAGTWVEDSWQRRADDPSQLVGELRSFLDTSSGMLTGLGLDLGRGVLQLSMSVFATFFFYRDGATIAQKVSEVINRISHDRTQELIGVVGGTVKSVVYGLLGTALAQGIAAGIGFWIAGVPAALLLALLTFFFSLVPFGPSLVWIGASLWLFFQGDIGWGLFIALWGLLLISTVDNFIKPYLISRGSKLPFLLVFFGVLGGVFAFGFIGLFLGPTLLAVGFNLLGEWTKFPADNGAQRKPAATGIEGG